MRNLKFGANPVSQLHYTNGTIKKLNPDKSLITLSNKGEILKHVPYDKNITRALYDDRDELKIFMSEGIAIAKNKNKRKKMAFIIQKTPEFKFLPFMEKDLNSGEIKFVGEAAQQNFKNHPTFKLGKKQFAAFAKDVKEKLGSLLGIRSEEKEILNKQVLDSLVDSLEN